MRLQCTPSPQGLEFGVEGSVDLVERLWFRVEGLVSVSLGCRF